MAIPVPDSSYNRLAQLEEENARLRRINAALIERVESGRLHHSEAYAAFKHSVTLAEQVRERTDLLNQVLDDLKHSNAKLTQASHQAEVARQNLVDAIESISDGFVLFDKNHRIALFNRRFQGFWQHNGHRLELGASVQEVEQAIERSGLVVETQRSSPQRMLYRLRTGRWLQETRRTTTDEGLVILYTDITELKQHEAQRREEELALKTRQLQQTVDNLAQGIALVSSGGVLELWNHRFLCLAGLQPVEARSAFADIIGYGRSGLFLPDPEMLAGLSEASGPSEQRLRDGRVVEVHTHALPDGNRLYTLTEITERYLHAEALRKSENWIRLITDHVPAMIAYVKHDLTYEFTNKVYEEWYQWSRGSALGRSLREAHSEAHFLRLEPYIRRALQGESVTFEVSEDGGAENVRYLQRSYVPNRQTDGSIAGIFVLLWDITERRRNAEVLHQAYQTLEVRVRERTRELTALNAQLVTEVEVRREAEGRLREAKREADEANLSKTKFLAAVSHDLLQPLNAARLFAGSLVEQLEADSPSHSVLRNISNSLDDVESLLGTLVDISRLDAGVIKADVGVFMAHELLDTLAIEYKELARSEGLVLDFVPTKARIRSDIHLLGRVLRNFLSNAIRYTSSGRIALGCRRRGNYLSIEVWDTGRGIAEDKQAEIFQEFKRGDHQLQDRGLGLGLAIVDKISRILGHRVSVHSVLDSGSCFAIEVPLAQAHEQLRSTVIEQQVAGVERLHGARICVLDNDTAICLAMQQLLERWGCTVVTALNELDLERQIGPFASADTDLLIVDYHLDHDVTGVEVIERINSQRQQPLQALMITANYSNELKQQMRNLGHTLMHKPVTPMRLKTTLSHLLESRLKGAGAAEIH